MVPLSHRLRACRSEQIVAIGIVELSEMQLEERERRPNLLCPTCPFHCLHVTHCVRHTPKINA